MRFCAYFRSMNSWQWDQIVQGLFGQKKIEFFLFWKDLMQGWIKDQIFIIARIWCKLVTLIDSMIYIKQIQSKSKRVRGVKREEQLSKNQEKVAIWFHSSRLSQAFPAISFSCWAFKESIPIINKHFRAQIRTVSIPRTPCFLEIESHKFGIVSMICLYILNPWNICKLMIIINCNFFNHTESCHD